MSPITMENFDLNAIAKRIKELRKSLRLSQEELGNQIGLSKATICDYEKGKTPPCFEYLYYFSQLAGVSIDSLVRPGDKPAAADSDPFSLPFYNREFKEIVDLMKKSPVALAGIITLASDFIRKNKSMIDNNLKLEIGKEKDE